jgi:broad specificity phosphatase PhoE
MDDLREISYGPWDGLTWDEIASREPELADRKLADWLGVDVPGGETWTGFETRVAHALALILEGPLPAAIVAHEGVNSHIARLLGGKGETGFHQNYCEILSYATRSD